MIQTILKSVDLEHCKGRHTLHIWLTTPNKLKGISPFQMRKFLILFITLSTCILKPAICLFISHLQQTFNCFSQGKAECTILLQVAKCLEFEILYQPWRSHYPQISVTKNHFEEQFHDLKCYQCKAEQILHGGMTGVAQAVHIF